MEKLKLSKTVTERALRALNLEKMLTSLDEKLSKINKRIEETDPDLKDKEGIILTVSDFADRSGSRATFSKSAFDVTLNQELYKKVYNSWLPAQHAILYIIRSFLEMEIESLTKEYNDLETLEVAEE